MEGKLIGVDIECLERRVLIGLKTDRRARRNWESGLNGRSRGAGGIEESYIKWVLAGHIHMLDAQLSIIMTNTDKGSTATGLTWTTSPPERG